MKRWSLAAAGLGAYALALVATPPATLIDAALDGASEGRLRLAQASGTLWSGTGRIEIHDADGRAGVSSNLSWRVVPQSLLKARLAWEIGLDDSTRQFPLTLSFLRIELANADIRLPATALGLAVPKLAPLGLTGDVSIHVASLSLARDAVEGNATLQWLTAGSSLTPVSPLGNYELRLDGAGRTIHAYLRTMEGSLRLNGQGSWTRNHRPAFNAMAHVPEQHRKQLVPLLRMIAVERSAGNFELQLD